jgi:hypothetical protein
MALAGGEWSASRPGRFTRRERAPGTHCVGDWVDPRADQDVVQKRKLLTLSGLELRPISRPALRHEDVWGKGCIIHIFLALPGGEWSASRLGRCTPGEWAPSTHWIGGWMDPRAGLDDVEKRKFQTLPGLELRPLSRPTHSQSLYRLRCPVSCSKCTLSLESGQGMYISRCFAFAVWMSVAASLKFIQHGLGKIKEVGHKSEISMFIWSVCLLLCPSSVHSCVVK